ncbi:MAG: oxidoreductase [Aestuariibaculum sp.]
MRKQYFIILLSVILFSCGKNDRITQVAFNKIEMETILQDSILSIRAIEILNDNSLAFAANNGAFGLYNPKTKVWQRSIQQYDSLKLHFRAVAHTASDFFMLTVGNPALLFKTGNKGKMELVYKEEKEGVFYDAMTFWNDKEGIAIGDSVDGCLSIIVTRNGGHSWRKLPCEDLPKSKSGEGAFAASNTNIKTIGNKVWVATTQGNIYYSENKGVTWQIIETPIVKAKDTEGIYSIDFYDENNGFAIGGDYTNPDGNEENKIRTTNGGKTWQLVAPNQNPGYRSCIQYVPNGNGRALVAVGFKGVDFSNDSGHSWKHLSNDSFYTIRFLNDSVAYAAGGGQISKLVFKK